MTYTIFSTATGQILRITYTTDIAAQLQEGEDYLEGNYADDQYYIDNKQPVEIPAAPDVSATFNYTTKQWTSNPARHAVEIRRQRDALLAKTDWRYRRDRTTTPEWDAYCQALRDVPAQAGFPFNVVWPTPPA
jgi:hypothetical protein